jgi:hypothetical protein
MKTSHGTLALSLAALLALGTSAMAVEPQPSDTSSTTTMDPATDETGFQIFGFNIAFAGNTPDAVKNFVSGLTPDQQQSASVGCGEVLSDSTLSFNTTVVSFCKNLNS